MNIDSFEKWGASVLFYLEIDLLIVIVISDYSKFKTNQCYLILW